MSLISRLACSSTSTHNTPVDKPSTLLIESHNRSRNSLTNRYSITPLHEELTVDLSNATTSLHGDTDVEVRKALSAQKQNGLNSLHSHALRLHHVNGLAVQLHHALSVLAVSNGDGSLLHGVSSSVFQLYPSIQRLTLRPKAWTDCFASLDII